MNLVVHTDGGARGNPGPAAIGVVIEARGEKPVEFGSFIGEVTNNVAEYTAVIEALKRIKEQEASRIKGKENLPLTVQFYLDSTLVVNQLNGKFKVKDANLRNLLTQVRILEQEVGGNVVYAVVPREQNLQADFLVNRVLDNVAGRKY